MQRVDESDLVCLYGLEGIEEYQKWLEEKEERLLLILEDEREFFQPHHPRIHFFFLPPGDEEQVFKQIAWDFVFLRFFYAASPQKMRAPELFKQLQKIQDGVHLVASDWSDLGMQVTKNAMKNLKRFSAALSVKPLFGRFQGVPAIICGGGPSLEKNGFLLKELEEKAMIIAGGTALPLLSQRGISPHFAAALCPHPPKERFWGQTHFETPLFYQNRVDPDLLNLAHAVTLCLPDAGSSLIERCFFPEEYFEAGWNVVTFSTAIAYALGCNPILFVGVDLAAQNGAIYSSGVEATCEEKKLVETCNEEGNCFFSKRDWLMAREWLSNFAMKRPETLFLNATEGGIGIPGIANIALKDAPLKISQDFHGRIFAALQSLPQNPPVEFEAVEGSLSRSQKFVNRLLERMEQVFPSPFFEDGQCTLLQVELEEEKIYSTLLAPFWEFWKRIILREEEALHPEIHRILFFKRILEGILNGPV
jgi:hypothetical protein